jgi:hypothetical protein
MSIKLTETQTALLSGASQREDRNLTPPRGGKLAQARKASVRLVEAGLVREVRAKGDVPVWRRDEAAGCNFALKLTAAGLKAIKAVATEDDRSGGVQGPSGDGSAPTSPPEGSPELASEDAVAGSSGAPAAGGPAFSPRVGSKIAAVIGMLSRAEGATIDEIVTATGWLPHTTRAALTGLRKRGYALSSDRTDRTRGSIYRIAAATPSGSSPDLGVGAEAAVADEGKRTAAALLPRSRRRPATPNAVVAGPHEAP